MMKTIGIAAALVVTALSARAEAACTPGDPDCYTCPGGATANLKTYKYIASAPGDTRATNGVVRLKGWWHLPTSTMPTNGYPTIIYSHGSEEMTSRTSGSVKCTIATSFTAKGFAVFVPHRRGHGESTGQYYDDYVAAQTAALCTVLPSQCAYYKLLYTWTYLKDQANDIAAAYNEIKTYPKVNANKMSLMGHSFGGITTMFANEQDLGQKAAVNFAGGAQSWIYDSANGGLLEAFLIDAVHNARAPMFFLDTKNDVTTLPVQILGYESLGLKHRSQATLFEPVTGLVCEFKNSSGQTVACADTGDEQKWCPADPSTGEAERCGDLAHSKFASDQTQVDKWVPSVNEYITRVGGK